MSESIVASNQQTVVRGNKGTRCILLALWVLMLMFSSCLKEEDPVTPPATSGNTNTVQIPLGIHYDKQFFFDLSSNQIVSSNFKSIWDLSFECDADGYHVFLNSSKLMFAWDSQDTVFANVTTDNGVGWKWDVASGSADSTAVGEWGIFSDGNVTSFQHVYIIDLGIDPLGNAYGQKKIIFESLTGGSYEFHFANLDGTDEHTFTIEKDANYSFVYFSFANGGRKVAVAPEKNSWDIEFTQYTHIFSETPDNIPQPDTIVPYLVTGVLQNPVSVGVAKEFTKPFSDITLTEAFNMNFIEDIADVIGFDWKLFNFDEMHYTVLSDKNYIIRDHEGYLYKLRFIDFYNDSGEKGYPKFEFQKL